MSEIYYHIEVHNVEAIREYFHTGGDPNEVHKGVPLFTTMVDMYTRSPRFADCVRVFVEHGLLFDNKALLAVFCNDAGTLEALIKDDPEIVHRTVPSFFNNAYTSLEGAGLLHYCAEHNHVACAKVLRSHGADINQKAGVDEYGFGGHTPLFHTVNQNLNNSVDMLQWLLDEGADLFVMVKGLIWGKEYEWETFIPAVNPISYAMMGLLPQMHRREKTVAETVTLLMKHAYGIEYTPRNVPNKYLSH